MSSCPATFRHMNTLLRCSSRTGCVSERGAVGVFGCDNGGADSSVLAVCAYTADRVVHRVVLQRPAAPPGDKVCGPP